MSDENYMEQPGNQPANQFPQVGNEPVSEQAPGVSKSNNKKGFENALYSNDSLLQCKGFVNEIKRYQKDAQSDVMYFARVGLIQGSVKNEAGDFVGIL